MIIKQIEIQNFRLYYKQNTFEFTNGLNLIIGGSGDGKTTFFDAVEWLFRTDGTNKMDTKLISKKRIEDLLPNDSDDVRVAMIYEHKGKTKTLEKSFRFTKSFEGEMSTSNYSFVLIEENGNERVRKDGVHFDKDIPSEMRKFIMFKGEDKLDILQSSNAMKLLVDNFSEVRDFDAYFAFMEYATNNANKARDNAQKLDRKNQDKIKELNRTIDHVKGLLSDIECEITIKENEAINYENLLKNIEKSSEASKLLISVNSRIENLKELRSETAARIREDYSNMLLGDMLVLVGYKDIAKEYEKRINALIKERHKMEYQHSVNIAMEKVKEAIETSKDFVDISNITVKPYYKHNYIGVLQKYYYNLSEVSSISESVQKLLAKNDRLHADIKKIEINLEHELEQKKRILAQSDGLTEEQLMSNYDNISSWMEKKILAEKRFDVLKRQRELHREVLEKAQLDLSKVSEGTDADMYAKMSLILQHISDSFKNAKELNQKRLLSEIENLANMLLSKLCPNEYTGTIRIIEKANGQGEAFLIDGDCCRIFNPGRTLRKNYLLAFMLVIGKLYGEKGCTELPIIVDGTVDEYEGPNGNSFFDSSNRQMIIITSDYLWTAGNGEKVLDLSKIDAINATIYRLEKKRPFDTKKLGTLQTILTRIQ